MLAIHNASGAAVGSVGAPGLAAQALTSVLYNGESFDTRIGQQYLRARWYDQSTGRFNRLDPFAGNPSDPFSFNKYGFVHGNPVRMTDPSGLFGLAGSLGAVGMALQMHLATLVQGALISEILFTIGSVGAQLRNAGLELLAAGNIETGMVLYELGGEIFGLAAMTIEVATTSIELFSLGVAAVGLIKGAKGFLTGGGLRNVAAALRALRSNPRAVVSAVANLGRRGGRLLSDAGFDAYRQLAKAVTHNSKGERVLIQVQRVADSEIPAGASAVYRVDPDVYNQYGRHYGVIKVKRDVFC